MTEYQLKNGEMFEGKYRILRELGRGGFGTVYLGFQESMDRKVALKVLRPSAVAQSSSAIQRFHREVKIISKLKHPNTVTIHDFGETVDGGLYMVLEYVEGEELKQILKREGPQDVLRAAQFAKQIARSLSEAHDRGVVHRDLKPANVMITKFGAEKDFIKVLDFGVASLLDPNTNDLTSVGLPDGERELIGTPRYMSPEQVRGELLTGASDIYSLGLILYELLCGHPAVRGDSTMALITQQISSEPLALPSLGAHHPRIQEIVRIATSKRTSDRFQTAAQMCEALEAFIFTQKSTSGNQSGGFELASYASQMPSWQGHSVTPSGAYPVNLQSGQFQQPSGQFQQPSGQFQPQPFQQHPSPTYQTGPQAPLQTPQAPVLQNQSSSPSTVFDPVDYHPTIERSALDRSHSLSISAPDLPPVPIDKDAFAVEEPAAVSRAVRSLPVAPVRDTKVPTRFAGPSVYFRFIMVSILAVIFGYIGFITVGALLGSYLDGGMRFIISILAVPVLPFIGGLVEGTRVQDRVRVVEPSLIPFSRGIFSASIFCLGSAILIGLIFPNKIVPRLERQPNWFLAENNSSLGRANTLLSRKVANVYKYTGSSIGMYDRMEADNVTGKRATPEPTRKKKDETTVPTPGLIPKSRRRTPRPTRPKTIFKKKKSGSETLNKKKKEKDEYVDW